jgi:hypothetical protein
MPRPAPPLPSKERLEELFTYDAEKGELVRRIGRRGKAPAGSVAGTIDSRGYRRIMIDGKLYPAYRLIFFMVKGIDPGQGRISFLDGITSNNAIENLDYEGPSIALASDAAGS